MLATDRGLPPTIAGYARSDVERFLATAVEVLARLEQELEAAHRRRDEAALQARRAAEARQGIARAWIDAKADADAIRRAAQDDAAAVLAGAEQTALALRARATLAQRLAAAVVRGVSDTDREPFAP